MSTELPGSLRDNQCLFFFSVSVLLFIPWSNSWQFWGEQVQEVLLRQVHLRQQSPVYRSKTCQVNVLEKECFHLWLEMELPLSTPSTPVDKVAHQPDKRSIKYKRSKSWADMRDTSACSNVFTVWMDSWSGTFSLTILDNFSQAKL